MKSCIVCGTEKQAEEFGRNKATSDGLNKKCKACYNLYMRGWYEKNSEEHKKRVRSSRQRTRQEVRQNLYRYYLEHPCIDCGETDPVKLELDHRLSDDKTSNIAHMVSSGCTWKKIEAEINKCDVRCANCHRVRTAQEFGWYNTLLRSLPQPG